MVEVSLSKDSSKTTMNFLGNIFLKRRYFLVYGALMAVLIFALKWLEWKFLIVENSIDIYVGLVAVFFTILGIWVAGQLYKNKVQTVIVEKKIYVNPPVEFQVNKDELEKLNLSNREYEVLQLLTKGHSNAEIAENLFLSLSTIKTHVSNIFVKMDVKSRTQAIEKAKRLKITD